MEFRTNVVRLSGGQLANENALSDNGGKNRAKNPANGQGGRYPVNLFI